MLVAVRDLKVFHLDGGLRARIPPWSVACFLIGGEVERDEEQQVGT